MITSWFVYGQDLQQFLGGHQAVLVVPAGQLGTSAVPAGLSGSSCCEEKQNKHGWQKNTKPLPIHTYVFTERFLIMLKIKSARRIDA